MRYATGFAERAVLRQWPRLIIAVAVVFGALMTGPAIAEEEKGNGNDKSRKRFRLSVTERVSPVRWARRNFQPTEHNKTAQNIEHRLDPIRDERVRMTDHTRDDFDDGQSRADKNSHNGCANPPARLLGAEL